MDLDPPLPKSLTSSPTSFAHTSARSRWPAILTSAIDDVHRTIATLLSSTPDDQTTIASGKSIVSTLASLKYELQHNRALSPLPDDNAADYKLYNDELSARSGRSGGGGSGTGELKWHDVEWLYAECYLYRRINAIFRTHGSAFWKGYDCFARQKMGTFRSSRAAVLELAGRYRDAITKLREDGKVVASGSTLGNDEVAVEEAEKLLFMEMAEICLWGNATDLSLLTQLTYEDIQKLQGSQARKDSESKIVVNDLPAAFDVLNAAKKEGKEARRVDIVLDNAGFELFVDFILAGYLIQTGLATNIILHAKSIPWFVSDVVSKDLSDLLDVLRDPRGFYENKSDAEERDVVPLSDSEVDNLKFLFEHWNDLHQEGKLKFQQNRFWTGAGSFWRMPKEAKGMFEELRESELVIFKGDLNYRKLTGDALWDPATPFRKAIGPLGNGSEIRTLALRTCKADVVVGLPQGKDEEIRQTEGGGGDSGARKWAWSGKWAVVQFCDGKA